MELRQCQPADLQAVIDLNETVYAALPDKSVLRHNSPEMIASCLEELNEADKAPYELTVSMGYTKVMPKQHLKAAIEEADKNLYEEKERFHSVAAKTSIDS